jgi:hypothetical protein
VTIASRRRPVHCWLGGAWRTCRARRTDGWRTGAGEASKIASSLPPRASTSTRRWLFVPIRKESASAYVAPATWASKDANSVSDVRGGRPFPQSLWGTGATIGMLAPNCSVPVAYRRTDWTALKGLRGISSRCFSAGKHRARILRQAVVACLTQIVGAPRPRCDPSMTATHESHPLQKDAPERRQYPQVTTHISAHMGSWCSAYRTPFPSGVEWRSSVVVCGEITREATARSVDRFGSSHRHRPGHAARLPSRRGRLTAYLLLTASKILSRLRAPAFARGGHSPTGRRHFAMIEVRPGAPTRRCGSPC